jgi:hypothetical protein
MLINRSFFRRIGIPGFLMLSVFILHSCYAGKEITERELRDHVKYLSSDSMGGRLPGSRGDSLSACYTRESLSSSGFQPLLDDGFQRFGIISGIKPGPGNELIINDREYVAGKDFIPLSFSADSSLSARVIFAGYGLRINSDSLEWDDYANTDVHGRWVMLLRGQPDSVNNSRFILDTDDREKVIQALDMGAAGVLLASGRLHDTVDEFEPLSIDYFPVKIPVLSIKRNVADTILSNEKITILDIEKIINREGKPCSFDTRSGIYAKTELIRETRLTRNVVMLLPGEDDRLSDEFIILGAHFDHLGRGGPNSGSRSPDTLAVHNGADDNASGVSMMLEIAEKFASIKGSHGRGIICIAFTGEEKGLVGSNYFTGHPVVDLSKVNAMLNLDMVGRLNEAGSLEVGGVGTAEKLGEIIAGKNNVSRLQLSLSEQGYGPSDHSSFYARNIPVLFFSTGMHTDYHTPRDTYEKINYKGMAAVSALVYDISRELANSPVRLQFREAGPKVSMVRQMKKKSLTLGIMPDVSGTEKRGLKAIVVSPGKPGSLGGMRNGDIITSINGNGITNIHDYMFRMSQFKHGERISVEVLRGEEKIILVIQL